MVKFDFYGPFSFFILPSYKIIVEFSFVFAIFRIRSIIGNVKSREKALYFSNWEELQVLKMFSTQLSGLFKRIHEKEEFAFEDGARLLAQAAISDGTIYIFGNKEMEAITLEATLGAEPMAYAKGFPTNVADIQDADRVLIVSRYSTDEDSIHCAKKLQEIGIPFVAISSKMDSDHEDLFDLADVSIDLHLTKGLLPDELGNRYGFPSSMAALFGYYGLKFTFDEILAEYKEE
jgi:hypothetical protein